MFTGLIERTGRILKNQKESPGLLQAQIQGWDSLTLGESISVQGICLTLVDADEKGCCSFQASPETRARTNLNALRVGALVNLERALSLGDRLGGHLVQGHIDGLARLESIEPQGDFFALRFSIPSSLSRYCVSKGSIALDGISLTLNALSEPQSPMSWIEVMIIPHTWNHTHLKESKRGDEFNVEVDLLAKYAEKLCHPYQNL